MNITIEPWFAPTQDQVKAIQTLATFGHRFAQLNVYAGLALLDNSTHHISTLVRSNDIDEVAELQTRAVLPAAESAKAYGRQIFALAVAASREFNHAIASQLSRIQDKVYDDINVGLTRAEEQGMVGAGMIKDSLKLTREAALSAQASIERAMDESFHLRDTHSHDDVTDAIAKPPKKERSSKSSAKVH